MVRLLLTFLLAAALPAQRVWVVAPMAGAGVDFTVIQDAVNAAVDGDMILVRAGSYATVSVRAKSLTIVADGGVFGSALEVRDLLATQTVAISGLTMATTSATPLSILNCVGPVTLRACAFSLFAPISTWYVAGAITGATQVTLVDCAFSAGGGFRGPVPGMLVFASTVHMHRCSVSGGSTSAGLRFPGAVGIQVASTFLHASQCTFRGGHGDAGMNLGGFCIPPTDGGHALYFGDVAATVQHLGCQFLPGQPGPPGQGCRSPVRAPRSRWRGRRATSPPAPWCVRGRPRASTSPPRRAPACGSASRPRSGRSSFPRAAAPSTSTSPR